MSVLGGDVTALNAYAATKNIKDSIEHKKKIRKKIAERNKK